MNALGSLRNSMLSGMQGGFLNFAKNTIMPTVMSGMSALGTSASNYLVNKGINAAYDGVKRFALGDAM